MKKYLSSTAVIFGLAAMPVAADTADQTDITQILGSVQEALNSINAGAGGEGVSQAAVNAGNLINRDAEPLDDVIQKVKPGTSQSAGNYLDEGYLGYDGWVDVDQDATNVLNSLSMVGDVEVEDLTQKIKGATQDAENWMEYTDDTELVRQDAVNAGNIASLVDVDNTVEQKFKYSQQTASNDITVGKYYDNPDLDDVEQAATNVANSLDVSGDVGDGVSQYVRSSQQRATNLVEYEDDIGTISGGPDDGVIQSAVNAANLATIGGDVDDGVNQKIMNAQQDARNTITGGNNGDDVVETEQTGISVANMLDVDDIGNFKQEAYLLRQRTFNNLDYANTARDIGQSATNAANVAEFDDVDNAHAEQIYALGYQAATNAAISTHYGSSMEDLTQEATNVINSMSGDDIDNGSDNPDVLQAVVLGLQFAANDVTAGYGGIDGMQQSSLNALNLIALDQPGGGGNGGQLNGSSVQWALSAQIADNYAFSKGSVIGDDDVTEQSAINAGNILTADTLPNILGTVDVQQTFYGLQSATNTLTTFGSVMDVAQSATNIANSIGMPSE